jgi:predicted nucleotidyltransferase
MNTVGIITEYNPFHNGHRYQIEQIKAQTGATNIVIVMSGDFVQRGTPAWTDKYLRTQMALLGGASLVFQLPAAFSTASAESFAHAGVSLLTSLGFVDGICFGCECDSLPLLQRIAAFLSQPPKEYEDTIAALTAQGLSYPAAREKALCRFFADEYVKNPSLFSSPNNILALEYLKAIFLLHSPLVPIAVKRNDSGYHHDRLSGSFSSASAIRKESQQNPSAFLSHIRPAVPERVHALLTQEAMRYPVTENLFSDLLYYRLTQLSEQDKDILDMTNEIFYRIQNQLASYTDYAAFTAQIKTKQYTYSRISRVLLHLLLMIYDPSVHIPVLRPHDNEPSLPLVPYARLLGFAKDKSSLLRAKTALPVITKPADGIADLQAFYSQKCFRHAASIETYRTAACQMYLQDIRCSNLYRQVQQTALGCKRTDEYRSQPVILSD